MEVRVLGALGVRVCGVSVVPSASKPRQVLGLLALRADQVVSAGVLAQELWGGRPPRSARTTVQTYVLQLRDLIARALVEGSGSGVGASGSGSGVGVGCAKDVLVTSPGGYMLNSGGGLVDVREFERLAGLGYRAMDGGDFPGGARLLGEALGLWGGGAFEDVVVGGVLGVEARRLEETRLCALDQRIEADLRLGRHRVLLAELTVLVERYRTHENLHGQFMVALHRSGRRGEALEVYARLRGTLVRELGMEPSVYLRRLQRSILMAAPDGPLERVGAGAGGPGAGSAGAGSTGGAAAAGESATAGGGRFVQVR
ncbi:BTAD domain-containing putative transcriptional regulator [Kitasatospora sp. NPDC058170]|uniref:AfsR/SARP family transcriptional regulator n=1 Tax=Kitasatospora sp. NPDC058170 TaxID=3346364 RepID=UPI0036DCD618